VLQNPSIRLAMYGWTLELINEIPIILRFTPWWTVPYLKMSGILGDITVCTAEMTSIHNVIQINRKKAYDPLAVLSPIPLYGILVVEWHWSARGGSEVV
jgi:hypothetical protein